METILVPVDFSAASNNATQYAAQLSRLFSSKLILLHAYHVPVTNFEAGYIPPVIDMKEESQAEMLKMTEELRKSFSDIKIEYKLEMGFAAELIEEKAKELDADLIIMGMNRDPGVLKEHVLGSVATKVAKVSQIPVLIVPENHKYNKVHKIAFACDFDKELEENTALIKVKYFASLFNAELEVLNVIKPEEEISVQKAEMDHLIEQKLKTTNHNTFFIYDDKVDHGLIEFITNNKVDLIITCPKNHNFLHKLFVESNTEKLAFHSPIPLLTIHA
jgi:nucleotide-binding universal stress UspA family protein